MTGRGAVLLPRARVLGIIALGGATGTLARHALHEAAPVTAGRFPWTTLLVNVAGALVLGLVVVRLDRHWWGRPLVGVGALSAFTTMSTFAVEVASLTRDGHAVTAGAYVLASVGLGVPALVVGVRTAER